MSRPPPQDPAEIYGQAETRRAFGGWRGVLPVVLPVLIAVGTVGMMLTDGPPDPAAQKPASLSFFHVHSGVTVTGSHDTIVRPGDQLQISYRSEGREGLAVFQLGPTGAPIPIWPAQGDTPSAVQATGNRLIPVPVTVGPGADPVVFVGVFDPPAVEQARAQVDAIAQEGAGALERWADGDGNVALIQIQRIPEPR